MSGPPCSHAAATGYRAIVSTGSLCSSLPSSRQGPPELAAAAAAVQRPAALAAALEAPGVESQAWPQGPLAGILGQCWEQERDQAGLQASQATTGRVKARAAAGGCGLPG